MHTPPLASVPNEAAADTGPTEDQRHFWDMISKIDSCMLISHGQTDRMNARPMHPIVEAEAREILFFTRLESGKSHELANSPEVCLTFSDPASNDFVAAQGTAEITQDRDLIAEHWSPPVKAWFPEGKDGPDVAMIRVRVRRGEYWDSTASDIAVTLKMMVAAASGSEPDLGENKKVSFA